MTARVLPRFRGLRSAASLKRARLRVAGRHPRGIPRTQIRGLIEASRGAWPATRRRAIPRTQIRGLIEASASQPSHRAAQRFRALRSAASLKRKLAAPQLEHLTMIPRTQIRGLIEA